MADEITPWQGFTLDQSPGESVAPTLVNRRSPVEERTINLVEVLAGLRGEKPEHAVRFKDLDLINAGFAAQQALSFNSNDQGSIGAQISATFTQAIDVESKALVEDFNATFESTAEEIATINQEILDVDQEIARLDQADADLTISFSNQIGAVSADLAQNYYTIASTDTAISAITTTLNASINAVSADLSTNYYTRASTDSAISVVTTNLNASIDAVSADLSTNYYTRASTDSAISVVTTTLNASINAVSADLSTNYYTRTSTDSAISTSFNSYSTTVNNNTSNISTVTQSVNGVKATHGVRVNNNGHVSGYGLISDIVNGQGVSNFIVNDASLRVVNSSGQGNYTPFAVYPSGRTVNGAYIPPGVHAQDLYVARANIGDLQVDTLKVAGNAITVPSFSTGSSRVGNGSFASASVAYINLGNSYADVYIWWAVNQGYGSGPRNWGYYITDNGSSVVYRDGMSFGNDYPSGMQKISNVNGSRTITFFWKGQDSTLSAQVSLQILARYK
jgi:hypothetical protein